MLDRPPIAWPALALCVLAAAARGQNAVPPRHVEVLPVFFVPKGEAAPTEDQAKRLVRHLEWCRTRYREMLRDRCTFAIAAGEPRVYRADRPLAFYRAQPEDAAPQIASELLTELKYNRCNCPYSLLVVLMNPRDAFPNPGGRPLNGGFNTGGGVGVLPSYFLDQRPDFQSTLQHELGHSFGLPHVDVYGYDMKSNDSVMSYNPRHHTDGFTPSPTPGRLIPEDLRGLALNTRAFPGLRFDPTSDVPGGYTMARLVTLGPMKIPGQPDGVQVTTDSGEGHGSKVAHVVQGRILPSQKTGKVTFDPATMWHSARSPTGWVSVQLTFLFEVGLTRVVVHSQHSGAYHPAHAVRVSVADSSGRFRPVAAAALRSADDAVTLPRPTKGRVWRFDFRAGESGCVVLRGLQFFSGGDELFPPLVPYQP
jgi:hypothetical protein